MIERNTLLFKDTVEMIGSTKAMTYLGLSRHTFEKMVNKGYIIKNEINGKTCYSLDDLDAFKETSEYADAKNGIVDKRNNLNDLTGKEWIPETKSYFFQKGLGADHPDAQIEKLHPAPYSYQDIEKLILFFTKKGMTVLDPFGGIGSTAKACEVSGRKCISIELQSKYHELSIKRLELEVGKGTSEHHKFVNADSCEYLKTIENQSIDFVVTSPPYWGILNKLDQKVKKNRVANNLDTKYSEDGNDLGNIEDYQNFLKVLVENIFLECGRVLKLGKYMAIVVSDFRDKDKYVSFHSDIIHKLNEITTSDGGKILLQGTKILIQNHKSLLPYGYPFSYVENIHHQYVLIFKKGK